MRNCVIWCVSDESWQGVQEKPSVLKSRKLGDVDDNKHTAKQQCRRRHLRHGGVSKQANTQERRYTSVLVFSSLGLSRHWHRGHHPPSSST
mmetsp:Transcript_2316/g.8887  ORF Transcript_2316/g.8887 Transcript_2316/m.8887 type:complete len:91 (-) Transcript_2316:162-434(-)